MANFFTTLPARFWGLLAVGTLAFSSSYAALVLVNATWADAQQLNCIYPDEGMCIRQFGPAAWQQAQTWSAVGALLLLASWLWMGPATRAGRTELATSWRALQQAGRSAKRSWAALTLGQRRFFMSHLALLTAVRLYLSWTLLWHDDAGSFELFVRHGWLAVAAYYPIPNNHLLVNTIALGLCQLYPGFWWSMRLPTLLASTLGTGLLFSVLLRRLGYWPALLAAGAVSWLQPSLYYAANGRGYWLVLGLSALLFWAMLTLLDEHQPDRLAASSMVRLRSAWLVLVGAGVLGCYTVPTFAYVLASGWSWIGWQALARRQWVLVGQIWGAGVLVILGAGLLYWPLIYVSGPAALLSNPYVQPVAPTVLWRQLPTYVWYTEGYLGGQFHLGALVMLAALGLFGWLLLRWRAGQLAPARVRQVREMGMPALWFAVVPYILVLGQRVFAPERTLLYKAWFTFLLIALGLANWRSSRSRRWLLGVVSASFIIYQLTTLLLDSRSLWLYITGHRAAYSWFSAHPQVLFPETRKRSFCGCAKVSAPLPISASTEPGR